MRYITEKQARRLAVTYLNDPAKHYLVYNIRQRTYILQDYYKFFYRFSRRESVWNTPIFNIERLDINKDSTEDHVTQQLIDATNQRTEDILNLKLKQEFTIEASLVMLDYYFHSKSYLAYYDYYLGRIVLIKERDKSNDFGELTGSRYHFVGDLQDIITKHLDIPLETLIDIMRSIMRETTPIQEVAGIKELNSKLHQYILKEIQTIEDWIVYSESIN